MEKRIRKDWRGGWHRCLWINNGADGPSLCRFLTRSGIYCERHQAIWWQQILQAAEHPEYWEPIGTPGKPGFDIILYLEPPEQRRASHR